MENSITEYLTISTSLLALLDANPWLTLIFDWLLKSIVIVAATYLLVRLLNNKLASGSKHLLWLNAFLCSSLIPIIALVTTVSGEEPAFQTSLIVLEVSPSTIYSVSSYLNQGTEYGLLIALVYILPCLYLLLRLLLSTVNVTRLSNTASNNNSLELENRLQTMRSSLHISRSVTLKFSKDISSPLSFGLFKPEVIFPEQARTWDAAVMDDVLIHELSHIKRLDWLSLFFAYSISCLFWVNPLTWLALSKLKEEAENSCDSGVLRYGRNGVNYAEHLLQLAKGLQAEKKPNVFAQRMLEKCLLPTRIQRLLENKMASATTHKLSILPLGLLCLLILVTSSNLQLLSTSYAAEETKREVPDRGTEEFLPIKAIAPQYPTRAAQRGIEGWALLSFTVNALGKVDSESVLIIDAEPAVIFDKASIRAALKFEFEPRKVNGTAEAVAGVQYLFRFKLQDDPADPAGDGPDNRGYLQLNYLTPDYPAVAAEQGIEGYATTQFIIDSNGKVKDITLLDESPPDIFGDVALQATAKLKYRPRIENKQAVETRDVQYRYNFTLEE